MKTIKRDDKFGIELKPIIFTTTDFTFKCPFQFSSLPHLRFRVPLTIGMKTVSISMTICIVVV